MSFLTDETEKTVTAAGFIIHFVDKSDLSQGNSDGSSYATTLDNARQGILNTDKFTAFATGGQTNAKVLTAYRNYVTVVADPDDSCKMPPAILSKSVFVKNKGANSMRLFPNETENFDGLAADAHIDFPINNAGIMFVCHTVGTWEVEI